LQSGQDLSQAEEWGWVRAVSSEVIVVRPIGNPFAFQCGHSECVNTSAH
jgi:hypothetical protein